MVKYKYFPIPRPLGGAISVKSPSFPATNPHLGPGWVGVGGWGFTLTLALVFLFEADFECAVVVE